MKDKVSKDSVDYRHGTEREHCGICTMFRAVHGSYHPYRCTLVEGVIQPAMTCDEFRKRKEASNG